MKVTKIETIHSKEPIPLPEPWLAAWNAPGGKPVTSLGFSFYKVYTDEGIVGIGPNTGASPSLLDGFEPFHVGEFWNWNMSGKRSGNSGKNAAGLEIALWDIIGKAANKPVYKLMGACRDKMLVYAATSRLLDKEQHVRQVMDIMNEGFKAVKLRLHRPNPWNDLAVVEAVRDVVGDGIMILVDANQNNPSVGYNFWPRRTALQMAKELDNLNVYYLEEPLPRKDVEGLAEIATAVDMFIAGGEHTPTIYDFKEHLLRGAYDIVQPDVILGGNMGITGIKKIAEIADYFERLIIPHVCSGGNFAIFLAATLQTMATVDNCPMVEYPYDPPILTADTMQTIVKEPILIDKDGFVKIPDQPGIGVELNEVRLSGNVVTT
ncbi:mandelate racemase/muconate lactonizing enzyme family protein [Candidatus Poribacteria bacterium]|nr:mandelate racemase/muconate lactonizing enzyme family protein [Candidatus Poribacteria bacterium]